jgi:hypothetical protein
MIKVGSKVNLIKEVVLTIPGKKNIVVNKKNPCKGTILSMRGKMVAGNRVIMCGFRPDKVKDDSVWTFGLKAFEEIKEVAVK